MAALNGLREIVPALKKTVTPAKFLAAGIDV